MGSIWGTADSRAVLCCGQSGFGREIELFRDVRVGRMRGLNWLRFLGGGIDSSHMVTFKVTVTSELQLCVSFGDGEE